MKRSCLCLFSCVVLFLGFRTAQQPLLPVPANWPKPVYDLARNPLTEGGVELGRILFYDPILSRDNTISCNSCHSPFTAFAHVDHALSHGIDNRIGVRNAPSLMNLAWQQSFMWDGAVNHLDMQPLAPISNPKEMDSSIDSVVHKLQRSSLYPMLFFNAFGDSSITGERTLKALSQFMLTVVSANAKYDSVMRKESVFTEQERRGYQTFKKNCNACHTEPLFTNGKFENNGLPVDTSLNDYGRMSITGSAKDSLCFKVPALRNCECSYPYMHDGRFKSLKQVIGHYTSGIVHAPTVSKSLEKPIVLTENEKVDLVAFLLTLTDRKFLFDARYAYPALLKSNR